jgi:hypothetical protein
VREETGWSATISGWPGSTTYPVEGGPKLVLFWYRTSHSSSSVSSLDWKVPVTGVM